MSFDFNSNVNPINKAQATYKDGGGLGGGGLYMRQNKKRKDEPDEDMFERKEENEPNEILFESEEPEIKEKDIGGDYYLSPDTCSNIIYVTII